MKKFLLFVVSLLPLAGFAQNNDVPSFLVEGKTWVTQLFNFHPVGYVRTHETRLSGDTIIDGIHFMRMYERSYLYGEEPPQEWIPRIHLIGQDGTKLFYRYESMSGRPDSWMFMDLDFMKAAGDSIMAEAYSGKPWLFYIQSVSDTVMATSSDQQMRKCMHVKSAWHPYSDDIWIEGVGSVTFGIENVVLGESVGGFSQLVKCYVGDEVLYEHEFDKRTPSFITLDISTDYAPTQERRAFFDLQGRRVEGQPRRGLYIRDGRKTVVK